MAIVRKSVDLDNLPPMTDEALARLDAIKDEDIDYSDIPELDDSFFENAWQGDMPPVTEKEKISVRLDKDVLQWLRSYGRGYQTRMNDILRIAMQHQKTQPAHNNDHSNPS